MNADSRWITGNKMQIRATFCQRLFEKFIDFVQLNRFPLRLAAGFDGWEDAGIRYESLELLFIERVTNRVIGID